MAIYKKKKKSILESILSYLTKKGNKKIAVKLFQTALFNCSKKLKIKCKYFLWVVFSKLYVSVEVRNISRKGKIFKVPFFISFNRQKYLSIRWFFKAVEDKSNLKNYASKIEYELTSLFCSKNPKSLYLRQQNIKLAISNRSNIHYRW